jgi:hypothetical protein
MASAANNFRMSGSSRLDDRTNQSVVHAFLAWC